MITEFSQYKEPKVGQYILDIDDDIGILIGINERERSQKFQVKHIKGEWRSEPTLRTDYGERFHYNLGEDDIVFFGTLEKCKLQYELLSQAKKFNI